MSSAEDKESILTMFQLGASDYLFKPFIHEEFIARVAVHLNERLHLQRLEELNRDLYSMAVHDELTRLYNRRYFDDWLEKSFASHRHFDEPMACIFLDIDHFKLVNDECGHDFGDLVLSEIGELIPTIIREEDLGARYGGEEFVVALPGTEMQQAMELGELIRAAVEQHCFERAEMRRSITISVGVAAAKPGEVENGAALVALADDGLYQAKNTGRNRVCGHGTTGNAV
jgi:diguanylate cyclase (GGDEF)-like protein